LTGFQPAGDGIEAVLALSPAGRDSAGAVFATTTVRLDLTAVRLSLTPVELNLT
jgi:hypothetical protein